MIFKIIVYYNLYVFLIPYLIFWIIFVYTLSRILYVKIFKTYLIIYYPNTSNSLLINFLIVLPKRIGFDSVYYYNNSKIISLHNIKMFFKTILLLFIVGLPLLFIKILYMYTTSFNLWLVWNRLSKYENKKLILSQGTTTRNMKNLSHQHILNKSTELTKTGLHRCEKGMHLVGYSKTSLLGYTATSKRQDKWNNYSIKNTEPGYAYAHKFTKDELRYNLEHITNKELKEIGETQSQLLVIKANSLVSSGKVNKIILNEGKKQFFRDIEKEDIDNSNKFLNLIGTEDQITDFTKEFEQTLELINDIKNMRDELINSNYDERRNVCIKYEKSYYFLKEKLESRDVLMRQQLEKLNSELVELLK